MRVSSEEIRREATEMEVDRLHSADEIGPGSAHCTYMETRRKEANRKTKGNLKKNGC